MDQSIRHGRRSLGVGALAATFAWLASAAPARRAEAATRSRERAVVTVGGEPARLALGAAPALGAGATRVVLVALVEFEPAERGQVSVDVRLVATSGAAPTARLGGIGPSSRAPLRAQGATGRLAHRYTFPVQPDVVPATGGGDWVLVLRAEADERTQGVERARFVFAGANFSEA